MKRVLLWLGLILALTALIVGAQETTFGKNKVRYKGFDWQYIQTRHFDIYFYEDAYETARFGATVLESAYDEVSSELNYYIQDRIPVFIYNSHNDFQQTNILPSLIGEGTGGFTEVFKNRMVVPFSGSYENFRHVLHHELTHAVTFDMLYGGAFSQLVAKQRLFSMPLWLAEGFAEYSSRHGWDYESDMWVRDATINGYLLPPSYLLGYNAYREGQALIKYIADTYGQEKVGLLFKKGKIYLSMDKTLKKTLGVDEEKLWKEFSKEMKRRYWPEIAKRKEIEEVAKKLTKSRQDGSYLNEKPVFTPEGDKLAIFTDKSDYTEIVLISVDDGRQVDDLVQAQRSGDLESLHSYVSGMSFSPDGKELVFVGKTNGKEALMFYDVYDGEIKRKRVFDYYLMLSPVYSPDGKKIAFSALEGNQRDIFVYYPDDDRVERLTNDRYDDMDPSWFPDSDKLVFSSDRPHPQSDLRDPEEHPYLLEPQAFKPGDFSYGLYNLFTLQLNGTSPSPLDVGPGLNRRPAVSPDGSKIAFISNRNGTDNVYVAYVDSARYYAITDILTGIQWLNWSPDGKSLALQAFNKGAYDVFILDEFTPAGDGGVLELTDYAKGTYDVLAHQTAGGSSNDSRETNISSPWVWNSDDEMPPMPPPRDPRGAKPPEESDTTHSEESVVTDTLAASDAEASDPAATLPGDIEAADGVDDADSLTVASGPEPETDTTDSDSTATQSDSTSTDSTGIYDDEFVFVGPDPDPFGDYMEDIPDSLQAYVGKPQREPKAFDSIPAPDEDGNYEVHDYEVKFTADYIGGGFAYDSFFGLRGQTVFMFSDYLGNHTIIIYTDLVNTLDQSNIQAYYFNSTHRTNYGFGLLHTKNFYLDASDFLFSDRFYGAQAFARRPFSTFSRLELTASQYFIDREYYDRPWDNRPNRSSRVTTGAFSYVTDNIIWGLTGPVNGRRAKVTLSGGTNIFGGDSDVDFYALDFDYRKYWHISGQYSFAFRAAGGASEGTTPKRYFLGGTTNYVGNRTLDAEVYDVENLYFSDVITPLRGYEYYEFSGNRYGLVNLEFRYPMIEYFAMKFPLPLVLSRVGGAIFMDMGAAWDDSDFKGGTSEGGQDRLLDIKSGFGFGMRANLGFILLRWDMAWATDFYDVADKPNHYFSIGADF